MKYQVLLFCLAIVMANFIQAKTFSKEELQHCLTGGACMAGVKKYCDVTANTMGAGCLAQDKSLANIGCLIKLGKCLGGEQLRRVRAIMSSRRLVTKRRAYSLRRASTQIPEHRRLDAAPLAPKISTRMVDSIIKVNLSEVGALQINPEVKLGYTFDILNSESNSMASSCFNDDFVNKHKTTVPASASLSYNKVVTADEQTMFNINGSLEMTLPLEVAEISGKANLEINTEQGNKTRTSIMKQIIEEATDTLDISSVKEEDLGCLKTVNVTHVVKVVTRGKRLEGTLTLTDNTKKNDGKVGGELEVKLASMPIGGKGSIDASFKNNMANYSFKAEIKNTGGQPVVAAYTVETFVNTAKAWYDDALAKHGKDDDNKVLSYELHPISGLKQFGTPKIVRSPLDQMYLSRAKPVLNDMAILLATLMKLKALVDDDVLKDKLTAKCDDVELANLQLAEAIANNDKTIKTLIDEGRKDYTNAKFMQTDLWKEVNKKYKPVPIPKSPEDAKAKCKLNVQGQCGPLHGDTYCTAGSCSQWGWCGWGDLYSQKSANSMFDAANCGKNLRRRRRLGIRK